MSMRQFPHNEIEAWLWLIAFSPGTWLLAVIVAVIVWWST